MFKRQCRVCSNAISWHVQEPISWQVSKTLVLHTLILIVKTNFVTSQTIDFVTSSNTNFVTFANTTFVNLQNQLRHIRVFFENLFRSNFNNYFLDISKHAIPCLLKNKLVTFSRTNFVTFATPIFVNLRNHLRDIREIIGNQLRDNFKTQYILENQLRGRSERETCQKPLLLIM